MNTMASRFAGNVFIRTELNQDIYKQPKLRVINPSDGTAPVIDGFASQRVSNATYHDLVVTWFETPFLYNICKQNLSKQGVFSTAEHI